MDDNKELAALSEEERERLKKIEKLDSNQSRKKFIFAGVTVFLIALFVFGTVFGAKYILSYEGTQELPKETAAPVEKEGNDALEAMKTYLNETRSFTSVKLDTRYHVSVPEEDIKVISDGVDGEGLLKFIRGNIENTIASGYTALDVSGEYGEDFSSRLPVFDFTADDGITAGLITNEENPGELLGHISFEKRGADDLEGLPVFAVFDENDVRERVNEAVSSFGSDVAVNNLDITYDKLDIDAFCTAEGKSGGSEMNRLVYSRSCIADFDAEFLGELAPYGKQHISMRVNVSEEFIFTRVSFDIVKDVYFIEKGDSDEINRKIVSGDSVTDITVTWESSAPDVLSVDKKGFYKGHKISAEPVTVTGTYVFNGVTYTDTVEFYVREPVESVKLSEKEIQLSVGDTFTLSPVIEPEDATLQGVYWFSTDENTVTVDENGNIKAVAPGEAGVYVITFDGNFKKTCAVSVTE